MATALGVRITKLEADALELRQHLNALSLTVDSQKAQFDADLLSVRTWMSSSTTQPTSTATPPQETLRSEPWRLPLEQFVGWKTGIEQNWEPGGNSRVGQKLAMCLRRNSGHAEGQLYINWCNKMGRAAVKAFWISRGFSNIPDGL